MKKQKHEEPENSERWLLSYADFITLLMVFFIIMYSMSAVNQSKFAQLAESFAEAMGGGAGGRSGSGSSSGVGIGISDPNDMPAPNFPLLTDDELDKAEQDALLATMEEIQRYLDEQGLSDSVTLKIDERGLSVVLADTTTFESGSADIKPEFVPRLIQIANILAEVDNYVRIEGHTDDVPVAQGGRYASNWEVSTARATSLVQLFIRESDLPPEKMSAIGYGEYRPIASNDTPEGRAMNRRVEIVVIRSRYNSMEAADTEVISNAQDETAVRITP